MAAGKIIIDIEARVGNLEKALGRVERMLDTSVKKQQRILNRLDREFNKLNASVRKLGKVLGIIALVAKGLEMQFRFASFAVAKMRGDVKGARKEWDKFYQSVTSLPVVGPVIAALNDLAMQVSGVAAKVERANKEIARIRANAIKNERLIEARRRLMEGNPERIRRTKEEIQIAETEDPRMKMRRRFWQGQVILLEKFNEQMDKARALNMTDAAIDKIREEFSLRKKLLKIQELQALAEFDRQKKIADNNTMLQGIAEALSAKIKQLQEVRKGMTEELQRQTFFSGLRTTATIGTAVGGFTSALGQGRQNLVEQAAKAQVRIQREIKELIIRIENLIKNRDTTLEGIV